MKKYLVLNNIARIIQNWVIEKYPKATKVDSLLTKYEPNNLNLLFSQLVISNIHIYLFSSNGLENEETSPIYCIKTESLLSISIDQE